MKRTIILAVGGALAGVSVALALFFFVFGGMKHGDAKAAVAPTPVRVSGRLGPHIVLADRVFNLQTPPSASPVYLKLQTTIEFETTSAAWARVLHGCARALPGLDGGERLVSAVPGGPVAAPIAPLEPGGGGGPCVAEEQKLLEEFAHEIGTGRQLIEDAVTSIVTRHTAAEIATPAGKEALKAEIKHAVEQLIPEPAVTRVLFTNFITQ